MLPQCPLDFFLKKEVDGRRGVTGKCILERRAVVVVMAPLGDDERCRVPWPEECGNVRVT